MREFAAALKLSREKGVGAANFRKLIEEYVLPSTALCYWQKKLRTDMALGAVSLGKSPTAEKIRKTLQMMKQGLLQGWYYSMPGYPEQLMDLSEPPPVFFATNPVQSHKYAAVVGARAIAPKTAELVKVVCQKLIAQGYAIVSGGAAGVDTVAHQTALDAGSFTLAVLGTGLDIVYPASNRQLFSEISNSGALMTELMPGTRPIRSFFPTRNRIIAAMAETVIVVQASVGSGSLITASWARRLGRRLLTLTPPKSGNDGELWAGNNLLIESGSEIFSI